MPTYQAPLADYQFILEDVLNIYQQNELANYQDIDRDLVDAILQGMADFSTDIMLPLNGAGDVQGCRLEDGEVITATGFKEAYSQFVENGWGTLTCDTDFGGQGLPEVVGTYVTEMQTSTNMAFAMYPGLTHGAYSAIHAHGSDELKQKYLPKLVSGEWTGTMNLTESHAGTDLALLRTKAIPLGDDRFAISGEKIFISSGDHDLAENIAHLVLARLPDAPQGVRGISLFVVPKLLIEQDGSLGEKNTVTVAALEHKMGIHGNSTCVMVFDEAVGELVGEAHQGVKAMFTMMNQARLGVGMQGLGLSEIAYQNALNYARERVQGRALSGDKAPEQVADPILVHGDIRRMLLSQKAFNQGARALVGQQALWLDMSHNHSDKSVAKASAALAALFTPVVKGFITDQAFGACVNAQQVLGGHGYIHEWGMEQFVRDCRISMIYEGTNGVQALDLVGRKVMGDNGAALSLWSEQVKGFIAIHLDAPSMQVYLAGLTQACKALEQATQILIRQAGENRDHLGAASMAYLEIFGISALAWMWAKMAASANLALDVGKGDADFYQSKLKTAEFYMGYWVPKTQGLLAQIEQASSLITLFDDKHW